MKGKREGLEVDLCGVRSLCGLEWRFVVGECNVWKGKAF